MISVYGAMFVDRAAVYVNTWGDNKIDASIYKFLTPSQDGRWLDVWGWTGGVESGPGGPL